jgi:hypothetical protein
MLPPLGLIFLKFFSLGLILLGFLFFIIKKRKSVLFFSVLVFINGIQVWEEDHFLWVIPHINKAYQKDFNVNLVAVSPLYFNKNISYRPKRLNVSILDYKDKVPWLGYLTGDFLMTDYQGGEHLVEQRAVQADTIISHFMQQPSLYLLLPENTLLSQKNIDQILETSSLISAPQIKMLNYSNNKITYKVNLDKSQIMLENEMYFPGWKATLSNGTSLSAVIAEPGLRAWKLPAGNYEMTAYFEMPYFKLSLDISLLSLILWLGIITLSYKTSTKSTKRVSA